MTLFGWCWVDADRLRGDRRRIVDKRCLPSQRDIAESNCMGQFRWDCIWGLLMLYALFLGQSAACLRAGARPRTRVESMAGERDGDGEGEEAVDVGLNE